jgi:hypothetical protein
MMTMPRLYRGFTQEIAPEGFHENIREDRRPRNSGAHIAFNICFNLFIERQFGVPLVRRRSLFVTGDITRAVRFAKDMSAKCIGIVEPVGQYRFLCAPKIIDSFDYADDITDRYTRCFAEWQVERCKPLLEDLTLTLPKMEAFFQDNPDVDKGGFAWSTKGLRTRIFEVLESMQSASHGYTCQYTDEDIQAAADSGAEIFVFDCPDGYRVMPIEESLLHQAMRGRRWIRDKRGNVLLQ